MVGSDSWFADGRVSKVLSSKLLDLAAEYTTQTASYRKAKVVETVGCGADG